MAWEVTQQAFIRDMTKALKVLPMEITVDTKTTTILYFEVDPQLVIEHF